MTRFLIAGAVLLTFVAAARSQELLRNNGFEAVTGIFHSQGGLPNEWVALRPSPDAFSTDGSWGLPPDGFGNFSGVVAFEGLRWVAGWSAVPEIFGQVLSAPLEAGRRYRIFAHLHAAVRSDLAHPGSYRISLWHSATDSAETVVGSFAPVTSGTGWVVREFEFVAPPDAASRSVIAFTPIDAGAGSAYPGCDLVSLTAAACPADVDDGSGTGTPDGGVTIEDLLYFLGIFAAGDIRADLDDGSGMGTRDGGVTIEDLLFFLTHFAAGC